MVIQERWRAQSLMLRALRAGDLASLVDLLDSGLDCDQTFSIGGGPRPAICLALEQVMCQHFQQIFFINVLGSHKDC